MNTKNKVIAAVAASAVALSAGGVALIQRWEGKENAPYRDIGGVWTVCYGSTGPHVRSGGVRTDAECSTLLRADAVRFEAAVHRCSAPAVLNQNQFDALVSFTYNVGETAYCNSTLARKVRAQDYPGAAGEFTRWSYVRGSYVQGLNNRRRAERELFIEPLRADLRAADAPPAVVVIRPGSGVGAPAR